MQIATSLARGIVALILCTGGPALAADAQFDSGHFSGSGNCAVCHNGLFDRDGNAVSIESDWSATIMANSARDPLWQAKFASEIRRNPGIEDELNATCTRCHTPMAHVEASSEDEEISFFDAGFANPSNFYYDAATDGVSCTLCHQIADDATLGTPEGFSGNFEIRDLTNPSDRPAYGPRAAPRVNPMRNEAAFTPKASVHVSDSALCASCHNLVTPVLDGGGQVAAGAEFHEQAAYTEWQHSTFVDGAAEAQACQGCHMARADGVKIANRPRNLTRRNGFARHGIYGGNTLVLDILDANREALDVGEGDFAASIEATRATLRSAAELAVEEAVVDAEVLSLRVRVINNTGHKLPTSYPSRRAYIHLRVSDQSGRVLFESGRLNPDGSIVGVDADLGAGFEPHYGEPITSADQVQVYEPILGDLEGRQTYTLLSAATYLKDNRIPPRGFDKSRVPEGIAVVGGAATDPNFVGGSDLVTYHIALGPVSGGITVFAELNYQTLAYGFLRDLERDADLPAVARFLAMYEASEIRAETMASTTLDLAVTGTELGSLSGTPSTSGMGSDVGAQDNGVTPPRGGGFGAAGRGRGL